MLKKLNRLINSSIFFSILLVLLGIAMCFLPQASLKVFSYILAILLIINGLSQIILDFKMRNYFIVFNQLLPSILSILFGVVICFYPDTLALLIPIVLGIWFIFSSIFKIQLSMSLKNINNSWILTLLFGIITCICGIVLIINPIFTSITITIFLGIMLIIYSISDIIDMAIFKKHINNIAKYFEEKIKIIES